MRLVAATLASVLFLAGCTTPAADVPQNPADGQSAADASRAAAAPERDQDPTVVVDWNGAFSGPDAHWCLPASCGGAGFGWYEASAAFNLTSAPQWSFDLTVDWDVGEPGLHADVTLWAHEDGEWRAVGAPIEVQGPSPLKLAGTATGAAEASVAYVHVSAAHHGAGDLWVAATAGQAFHVGGQMVPS